VISTFHFICNRARVCSYAFHSPYLLRHAEPAEVIDPEHVVEASAKLIILDKFLKDLLPKGHRVLVFTQWTG